MNGSNQPGFSPSSADPAAPAAQTDRPVAPPGAPGTGGAAPRPAPVMPNMSANAAAVANDPAHEQPVWQGRTSWKHVCWQWVLWLPLAVLFLYMYFKTWMPGMATFIIIAASAAVLLARQAYRIFSTRYRLTTQRLFFDRGLISMVTDQTELVRVDDVRLRKNPFDRLLGTGSVEIKSTDMSDRSVVLAGIQEPERIAEEIRRHTRIVRSRQTLFVENV